MRTIHRSSGLYSLILLTSLSLACGDDAAPGGDEVAPETIGDDSEGPVMICDPGSEQACTCDAGGTGTQTCLDDGTAWGPCGDCFIEPVCGDSLCEDDKGEDCSSCEADCGLCLDCAEAPSCEAAAIPGIIDTHLESLDVLPEGGDMNGGAWAEVAARQDFVDRVVQGELGVRMVVAALDPVAVADEHPFVPRLRRIFADYPEQARTVTAALRRAGMGSPADYRARFPEPRLPAGAALTLPPRPEGAPGECEDPKLRLRLAKIIVHDEADLLFKDTIYCAVVTEAMTGAEIRVTPQTFALDNGDEYVYSLAEGVVWGQLGEPVAPKGNLAVTYNCLEADGTGGFEEFLGAIGDAALDAGGLAGVYGWVFGAIGLASEIIGAALSLEKDDHLFNASQIIPADLQLEMTNGVWWSVQRTGTFMLKNWHWELRMEAWGCTDDGIG